MKPGLFLSLFLATALVSQPAAAQAPPGQQPPPRPATSAQAPESYWAIGVTGDLAFLVSGLTVGLGTGGAFFGVTSSFGLGCYGGRAIYGKPSGLQFGFQGENCNDFDSHLRLNTWYVGPTVSLKKRVEGKLVGAELGIGYGQSKEPVYEYSNDYMYFRPRGGVTIVPTDFAALDLGIYIQLPIYLSSDLRGERYPIGFTPWFGFEATIFFGNLKGARAAPPPAAPRQAPPAAVPANQPPPPASQPPPQEQPLAVPPG